MTFFEHSQVINIKFLLLSVWQILNKIIKDWGWIWEVYFFEELRVEFFTMSEIIFLLNHSDIFVDMDGYKLRDWVGEIRVNGMNKIELWWVIEWLYEVLIGVFYNE